MKTEELISLYREYYNNPSISDLLVEGIANYSFDDIDRILYSDELNIYPKHNSNDFLKSNTGKKYNFSPREIIKKIEYKLRYQFPFENTIFIWDQQRSRTVSTQKHVIVGNDCHSSDFRQSIIENLSDKTYIYGYAHSLNQLANDEELLIECDSKISGFCNTDVPCFVKSNNLNKLKIHLNDQMIDWKSGINFYTCKYNKKHFLPTFSIGKNEYKNIINLTDYVSKKEDYIKINPNVIKCECGRERCEFEFIPHYKNFLDGFDYNELMDLRNKLISKFRWIQFIQIKKIIHVYYEININSNLQNEDIDIINEIFNEPVFLKGKFFKVGLKTPAFWKVTPLMQ